MRFAVVAIVLMAAFYFMGGSEMLGDLDLGLPSMPAGRGVMHR